MHAEMLIENFDALTAAPGGLTKLRSLILALAMRGMLTAQQDGDDSAAALETAALKLVSPKTRKHFAEFEPFHSIPRHWKWVRLGAISTYSETTKIEPDANLSPETWVLELEDIEKETSALIRRVFYQDRNFQSTKNYFEAGYVLYGKLRPYLDKVLVADQIGVCTTEIIPFKPLVGICPHFIRWCLKSPDFIRYADNATHGMSLPRLGTPAAINAPMPLPPLAEQRRIVAKVDELMGLCDRLEGQQAKQSNLKLVTASAALNGLAESKSSNEAAESWAFLDSNFSDLFDDCDSITSLRVTALAIAINGRFSRGRVAYQQIEIGKIQTRMDSGWSPKCEDRPAGSNEWGVLKTTAVQSLSFRPFENKALPSNLSPRPEITVNKGDILLTRAGPRNRVGIVCVADETHTNLMLSDKIIRFSVDESVASPEYVALALSGGHAAAKLESAKSGMADSQLNISQAKLRSISLSLPLLDEQARITEKVAELRRQCELLERQIKLDGELNKKLVASLTENLIGNGPGGGGLAPRFFSVEDTKNATSNSLAANAANDKNVSSSSTVAAPIRAQLGAAPVDTKFQEAALVGAIVKAFFSDGGEPIGNFRLQKAVYFARRHNADPSATADFLKKAAGPYNPSMKYSGGIAIAKAKNYITEARGRYGFGHIPGAKIAELDPAVERYGYGESATWVNQHFKFKKNEEWELLATVDYAMLQLRDATRADILAYVANDPEWRPKIEKLGLTEFKIESAMLEIRALFPNSSGAT